jgi:hypothetical protein
MNVNKQLVKTSEGKIQTVVQYRLCQNLSRVLAVVWPDQETYVVINVYSMKCLPYTGTLAIKYHFTINHNTDAQRH